MPTGRVAGRKEVYEGISDNCMSGGLGGQQGGGMPRGLKEDEYPRWLEAWTGLGAERWARVRSFYRMSPWGFTQGRSWRLDFTVGVL